MTKVVLIYSTDVREKRHDFLRSCSRLFMVIVVIPIAHIGQKTVSCRLGFQRSFHNTHNIIKISSQGSSVYIYPCYFKHLDKFED